MFRDVICFAPVCAQDNWFCSAYFYTATLADTSNLNQRRTRVSARIKHHVLGFTCIFLVKRLFSDFSVFQWLANDEQEQICTTGFLKGRWPGSHDPPHLELQSAKDHHSHTLLLHMRITDTSCQEYFQQNDIQLCL
jgi:hypothetical protein